MIYGNDPTPFVGVVVLHPCADSAPSTTGPVLEVWTDITFTDLLRQVTDAIDHGYVLRIAKTDTNFTVIHKLVSLGGLSCDVLPDGDSGWLTVTIVGGE